MTTKTLTGAALTALLLALATASAQGGGLRIGMAYDAGGKFDRSFNQSAFEGSQRAVKQLGVTTKDFEPSDPSQVTQGIRSFAKEGFDLTVGVGFNNEASITSVANANPDLNFAIIDAVSSNKANVASLIFKEEEGSFLVGYVAGLNSSTGVVGFMGGMDIPLIHKFEAGFTAGVKAANPKARVVAQYVGTTPDAWNNPVKGKEIASSMRAKGADIIFHAAGGSGNGLIDFVKQNPCISAANLPKGVTFQSNNYAKVKKNDAYAKACAGNTRPMFFIGVDSNQNYLGDFDKNPATMNHGLTSMLKRVDTAVFNTIKAVRDGTFKGGVTEFGLKQNGVGYALDEYNQALISAAQRARLEKVRLDIIAGKIKVPTR